MFTLDTFQPQTNWKGVRANLPGRASAASTAMKVFVSSAPARLIRLIVEPACAPVAGTFSLWVSNTENDPFRHKATGASSCQLPKSLGPGLISPLRFAATLRLYRFTPTFTAETQRNAGKISKVRHRQSLMPDSLRSRVPAYGNDSEDWIAFPDFTGFAGMLIGWSCAGWGTCWWSSSCLEYGGFHSAFIRNPPTYGFAAWHDSYTGTFGRGAGCVWSNRRRWRLRGV